MKQYTEFNALITGRMFQKMLEKAYMGLRKKYGIKQIEVEIMLYLSKRPDDSARDISRNLSMNKGHVSQAMNRLCVDGYLKMSVDPKDRRYQRYRVTPKGRRLIEELEAVETSIQEQVFNGLSEEDWTLMIKAASILTSNIDGLKL